MKISERVRAIRGDMSRAKFAEHFGVPARTLDDWENERRVPVGYVVDLLAWRVAFERVVPTAWVLIDVYDDWCDGSSKYFTDKEKAIRAAQAQWKGMTEDDRTRRDFFYVALYELEWDEDLEEFEAAGEPLLIVWDALK